MADPLDDEPDLPKPWDEPTTRRTTQEPAMPDTPDPDDIDIADGDEVPPSEEDVTQDPAPYDEDAA